MNWFEKFLYNLQGTMETPTPYGWFHLLCVFLTFSSIIILFLLRKKHSEKSLKWVLGIYGIIAFILELLKQLIWSFNYDPNTLLVTWDYTWYAAPFQLCTTPMYVSLLCLFLKKNKVRDSLLSYVAFYTILGSIMTIIIPDSCFTQDILINIHTMYLHCGSLVVSVYLLISKEIEINYINLLYGLIVFIIFVFIANTLNIIFYQTGIIGDETFNMFYISPYFISSLPIYNTIQKSIPYVFYLMIYIISIYLGSNIIFLVSFGIQELNNKLANKKVI